MGEAFQQVLSLLVELDAGYWPVTDVSVHIPAWTRGTGTEIVVVRLAHVDADGREQVRQIRISAQQVDQDRSGEYLRGILVQALDDLRFGRAQGDA